MPTQSKRATVYLDADLHKALRIKAAETDSSISELVNSAIKGYLNEDAEDLAAFDERKSEPSLSFEEVVKKLKSDGRI